MKHITAVVAASLALAACGNYSLVSPSRQSVQGRVTVETGIAWNKVNQRTSESTIYSTTGPVETWTVDGEKLDSLVIFAGVADGAPLLTLADKTKSIGVFRGSMSASEVMELVDASLVTAASTAATKTRDLRPAKVGGVDGFRFEIDYALHDDIDRVLSAAGAIHNGKLYLILFQGTSVYYYSKYLPEYERIVASASFS
ncbi:MAG TPA: hypothetical protein VMU85_09355 [Stellaceae bacterium]|nr:hypothetical protein [Stellaceae bacterium]